MKKLLMILTIVSLVGAAAAAQATLTIYADDTRTPLLRDIGVEFTAATRSLRARQSLSATSLVHTPGNAPRHSAYASGATWLSGWCFPRTNTRSSRARTASQNQETFAHQLEQGPPRHI